MGAPGAEASPILVCVSVHDDGIKNLMTRLNCYYWIAMASGIPYYIRYFAASGRMVGRSLSLFSQVEKLECVSKSV